MATFVLVHASLPAMVRGEFVITPTAVLLLVMAINTGLMPARKVDWPSLSSVPGASWATHT